MPDTTSLKNGLAEWNIGLSGRQTEQFLSYYEMLTEKNKVMNLTAITDYEEVVHKHFIDSLALALSSVFEKRGKLIDVGTGAGFPGIPLKIAFPEIEVVLLDSLNKRVGFLNEVIEQLGLTGIRAVHGRAEDAAREAEYREQFDFCVSRAVANLSTLAEYGMPFVKQGGYFVPYKSGKVVEEMKEAENAVKLLSGRIKDTISFVLPGTDMERTLILIQKTAPIHKKYPRKAGTPQKEPL